MVKRQPYSLKTPQAAYEKSAELREARREKLLEYTRRQGKAYTLTATIAAKMQRVKMIEKEDAAAAEEADEFAHLGVFCMFSRSLFVSSDTCAYP